MVVSSLPPVKPGTHVVHLPSIGVVTHLWDVSGVYKGVYLLGQSFGDFVSGHSPDQDGLLYLGSGIETQDPISADPKAVVHMRRLSDPETGMDKILVIRRDGTLLEFGNDTNGGGPKQLSSRQLPVGDSGRAAYFIIGYWVSTYDSQQTQLLVAVYHDGQWQLTIPGRDKYQPLGLSNITQILGAGICQYGLKQRLNIWGRDSQGQKTNIISVQSYVTHLFSYDLASCVAALSPQTSRSETASPPPGLTLDLPERVFIQSDSIRSIDFTQGSFVPGTNDEQMALRFTGGTTGHDQYLCVVEVGKNKDGNDELRVRARHTWQGAISSMFNQQVLVWPAAKPEDTIFVLPYMGGEMQTPHLALHSIKFNWDNNAVMEIGDQAFPVQDQSAPSGYAAAMSWGASLRPINPQTATIMIVMKTFIIRSRDSQSLQIQSVHIDAQLNSDKLEWQSHGWDRHDLPTWLATQETFMITPGEENDFGPHQLAVFETDWVGDSFIYGAPKLIQNTDFGQIIGLYEVPPFEMDLQTSPPQLTIDLSDSTGVSNSVSQHSSTNSSVSTTAFVGAFGVTLNASINSSWTDSYLNQREQTQNIDVRTTINYSQEDGLQAVASFLQIWTYPIYSKGGQLQGEVAFYLPQSDPSPGFYSTGNKSFPYKQNHEVGMILSYLEPDPSDGYDPSCLMFKPIVLPVLGDSSSSSILSYDVHNTTMSLDSESHSVDISGSVGVSLDADEGFFKANAGLQYSADKSKDSSSVHDVTTSNSFGLTFHLGYVDDPEHEYQLTPLVYRDAANLKRIRYDVNLSGLGWNKYFSKPNPVMFRVLPFSQNALFASYSRSIQFIKNQDSDDVLLRLQIFNNGFGAVGDVICNIYNGIPSVTDGLLSVQDLPLIQSITKIPMTSIERLKKDFPEIKIKKGQRISIQLASPSSGLTPKIYWGCYPYSDIGEIS